MKKTPIYLETDLIYLVVTYNLMMMPNVVHLKEKSAKGRFAFAVEDDPIFTDVLMQVTSKGKVNIYPPEGAPKEEIVEKTLKLLSEANQAPVKVLRKQETPIHYKEEGNRKGRRATLRHSRQLSLGLEAILAEDWYLYRYQEDSRERARWKDKIEREGVRLKEFAIEHLRSGYPDTYDKLKRWRKLKEALLKEGNSMHDVDEAVTCAFFGEFPRSSERRKLLVQGIAVYRALKSDLELIILRIEAGKRLRGDCKLCSQQD